MELPPLSVRANGNVEEFRQLYDAVPSWMQSSLSSWLVPFGSKARELAEAFEIFAHVEVPIAGAPPGERLVHLMIWGREADRTLDVLDFVL